jgi:hypothetical protein
MRLKLDLGLLGKTTLSRLLGMSLSYDFSSSKYAGE